MIVGALKEVVDGEKRVVVTPQTVKDLLKTGLEVHVQSGAGHLSFFSDSDYENAGAKIISSAAEILSNSDLVIKVATATLDEIEQLKNGSSYISLIQTTREVEIVKKLTDKKISAFSMHLIPRTTLAQSMDALSSQANVAGYKSVLAGAVHLPVYMPLLMTAAGTIPPAKVLIIGAGVAGLQAIATAKRLGAQVEAFDVRPEVKEQVESLGAKFVEVQSEDDEGVGEGGYAKETSDEYKEKQQALMKEHISKSDLVITTALIPGKPAPILIPSSMVDAMKKGSVIVDLAAENGGNCEDTVAGEVTTKNGVIIDGTLNLPSTMQVHSSQLYAKNISTFISHMTKDGILEINMEDEIVAGSIFTHQGKITHEPTQQAVNKD
ncbi:MAG: Re/Si-specific NAD(P)(+) transhydrogenase subunit alpha [Candidatus Neomarinimicrobiota bacterium]|nr:MAG: Re/Si-specific NAD(P)(+) transhydrogenase subunit alpha [bacterium]|tara:strand:+ start:1615 stop:2751 length:1137 start_codon:yes stop_codon:yes gene_type:complete